MRHTIIGLLLFCSCNEQNNTVSVNSSENTKTDSLDVFTDTIVPSEDLNDTINYTDINGLKQGTWKKFLNGKIWKIETYKDNLLDGKHYEYQASGEVFRTDYVNGIKHGYFLHYNPDSTVGNFVTYWEKGEKIWSAFPVELNSYIIPYKGFITEKEKVEIKVPYNSGKLMYQGTITSQESSPPKAIGIHKAYYESGKLKATIDYNNDSIKVYNIEGKLIKNESIDKWR